MIVRFKARSNPLLTYGSECMCGRVSDNNDLSTVRLGPTEVELPAESRWLGSHIETAPAGDRRWRDPTP